MSKSKIPPKMGKVEKLLYRRQEAAFALGLSVRSIDAMISDQRLRTRRFGRCILIPAADVHRVAQTIIESDMLEGAGTKKSLIEAFDNFQASGEKPFGDATTEELLKELHGPMGEK